MIVKLKALQMFDAPILQLKSNLDTLLLISLSYLPMKRRYWMMQYNQAWFEKMWGLRNDRMFQDLWIKEFRMSAETFEFVVNLVRLNLEKQSFRNAITVEKRVAVAIWRLSTGNSYRTVSKVFGIGKSTVIKITKSFVKELIKLAPQFIKFPKTTYDTANAIQLFKIFCSCELPQVLGAIDGTHIEIMKPDTESAVDYFSRKQKYTVNTQAVVGANLLFLDVATGFPGSIHDARMLRATKLFNDAEAGVILVNPTDIIEDQEIRPLLLGDGAYPPTSWQVKPFPQNIRLTNAQKRYNKKLSSARVTVERAFGLLKGCWKCLLKRLDNNLDFVPYIIISCCVLHNICQIKNEKYIDEDEVIEDIIQKERQVRQSRIQCNQVCNNNNTLRDVLVEFLDAN